MAMVIGCQNEDYPRIQVRSCPGGMEKNNIQFDERYLEWSWEGDIQALQACMVLFYVPRIACEVIYIQTL